MAAAATVDSDEAVRFGGPTGPVCTDSGSTTVVTRPDGPVSAAVAASVIAVRRMCAPPASPLLLSFTLHTHPLPQRGPGTISGTAPRAPGAVVVVVVRVLVAVV